MDVKCVVCGEPWDFLGVTGSLKGCGDMAYWEAVLFQRGAGCPSCAGERPDGDVGAEFQRLSDFDNGDEDPAIRIGQREDVEAGTKPEWKRPKDTLLWECGDCGHKVFRSADYPPDSSDEDSIYGVGNHRALDDPQPHHVFGEGESAVRVCSECYSSCDICGTPLRHGQTDLYGEGYSVLTGDTELCLQCHENEYCSKCESLVCSCSDEEEDLDEYEER